MTLTDEVLMVIREARHNSGDARLSVREIANRVAFNRWCGAAVADKLLYFMQGNDCRPADEEVHDAVHELQKTHPNLVSLRRTAHPRVAALRVVHSR